MSGFTPTEEERKKREEILARREAAAAKYRKAYEANQVIHERKAYLAGNEKRSTGAFTSTYQKPEDVPAKPSNTQTDNSSKIKAGADAAGQASSMLGIQGEAGGGISGLTQGMSMGAVGGTPGIIAGGVLGATAGVLGARAAKKARLGEIEALKQKRLGEIEEEKADRIQNALNQMRQSFSMSLNNIGTVRLGSR